MFTINAKIRKDTGKGASRRLRIANKFPAIVYGGNNKEISFPIELDHDVLKNMEVNPEFYSKNITLVIDRKKTEVKVQAIQRHPFKPKLTHIDFIRK